jgi:hypothetical protein
LADPDNGARVRVPADVELEDRIAFGLTVRQLAILAGTAFAGYSLDLVAARALPVPVALALVAPLVVAGATLALVRLEALPADRLAAAAVGFLRRPRQRVLGGETLASPLKLSGARGVAPFRLPVRDVGADGLVAIDDGSYCRIVRASGTSFLLRSGEEQAALVEAFARFLNALTEPVSILVRSEPVDLQPLVAQLETQAATLPPQLATTARAHGRFLAALAAQDDVRRREILVIFTVRARDPVHARQALHRRLAEAREILRPAAVELHELDGTHATALLSRIIDPPGAPPGTQLTGVVRAC